MKVIGISFEKSICPCCRTARRAPRVGRTALTTTSSPSSTWRAGCTSWTAGRRGPWSSAPVIRTVSWWPLRQPASSTWPRTPTTSTSPSWLSLLKLKQSSRLIYTFIEECKGNRKTASGMETEKEALLSVGDSAPSSPNVPVVQPLVHTKVRTIF